MPNQTQPAVTGSQAVCTEYKPPRAGTPVLPIYFR